MISVKTIKVEGNAKASWDFKDSDFDLQGCIDAQYKVGLNSTFKARLMAKVAVWEMGLNMIKNF